MNHQAIRHTLLAPAVVSLLCTLPAGPAAAQSAEVTVVSSPCACDAQAVDPNAAWVLPPVYKSGAVRYRTGGIGRVEAEAMRADRQHYPLALEFLVRAGPRFQYTSHVTVEIAEPRGDKLLGLTTDGPLLLADVPPGHYQITAIADDGRVQVKEVDLIAGTRRDLSFVWDAR